MVNALFTLPAIDELSNSALLLLGSYCKLFCGELPLLERMLDFCYAKLAAPALQPACVELFRSVCKEGARCILRDEAFTRECALSR